MFFFFVFFLHVPSLLLNYANNKNCELDTFQRLSLHPPKNPHMYV